MAPKEPSYSNQSSGAALRSSPDIVLLNAKVFTADPARRYAEAVAIAGEQILAIGPTNEIAAIADAHTRRFDLRGRVVIPGINDAHFHHTPDPRATMLSFSSMEPSWDEVMDKVAAAAKDAPKGTWILGTHGVMVVNDPHATRFDLDRVAPDHPIRLNAYFGHGSVYNSRALAVLQITEEEPDPVGGCCERIEGSKSITGKLFGYAQWPGWTRLARAASEAEVIGSVRQLAAQAIHFGVTSIQNMTLPPIRRYAEAIDRAKLPIRLRVIRFPSTGDRKEGRDLPRSHPGSRVTVSGTASSGCLTELLSNGARRCELSTKTAQDGPGNFTCPRRRCAPCFASRSRMGIRC
jgi:hypothetical protein